MFAETFEPGCVAFTFSVYGIISAFKPWFAPELIVFQLVTGGLVGSAGFEGVQVTVSVKFMLPSVVGGKFDRFVTELVVGVCADSYKLARSAVNFSMPDSAA